MGRDSHPGGGREGIHAGARLTGRMPIVARHYRQDADATLHDRQDADAALSHRMRRRRHIAVDLLLLGLFAIE
jgi:hypothetical protein